MKAPLGGGNIAEGFLWLDLNDQFLEQWDKFCLHRQIRKNDEDYENESAINSREENFKESRLLSTYMLKSKVLDWSECQAFSSVGNSSYKLFPLMVEILARFFFSF